MIERKPGERVKFNTPGHPDHGKPATVVREHSRSTLGTWAMYVVRDDEGHESVPGDWELVGIDIPLEAARG